MASQPRHAAAAALAVAAPNRTRAAQAARAVKYSRLAAHIRRAPGMLAGTTRAARAKGMRAAAHDIRRQARKGPKLLRNATPKLPMGSKTVSRSSAQGA